MNAADHRVPSDVLRVMQIINGAMLAGVVVFLGIVVFLGGRPAGAQGAQPAQALPLISLAAAVALAGCLPMSIIVPAIITKTSLRQIADGSFQTPTGPGRDRLATVDGKLLSVRQTTMIIGLALVEGTGFFACIAYLLEHQLPVLAIVGLVILVMLVRFPTAGKVNAWLEQQAQALVDLQRAKDSQTC